MSGSHAVLDAVGDDECLYEILEDLLEAETYDMVDKETGTALAKVLCDGARHHTVRELCGEVLVASEWEGTPKDFWGVLDIHNKKGLPEGIALLERAVNSRERAAEVTEAGYFDAIALLATSGVLAPEEVFPLVSNLLVLKDNCRAFLSRPLNTAFQSFLTSAQVFPTFAASILYYISFPLTTSQYSTATLDSGYTTPCLVGRMLWGLETQVSARGLIVKALLNFCRHAPGFKKTLAAHEDYPQLLHVMEGEAERETVKVLAEVLEETMCWETSGAEVSETEQVLGGVVMKRMVQLMAMDLLQNTTHEDIETPTAILRCLRGVCKARPVAVKVFTALKPEGFQALQAHYCLLPAHRPLKLLITSIVHLCYSNLDSSDQSLLSPFHTPVSQLIDSQDITPSEALFIRCQDDITGIEITSAIKIQKIWRGRHERKQLKAKLSGDPLLARRINELEEALLVSREPLLQNEFERREIIWHLKEVDLSTLKASETLGIASQYAAAELQQRTSIRRQEILQNQKTQKEALANEYNKTLSELKTLQEGELVGLDGEKEDLVLLGIFDQKAHKEKNGKMKQRHARDRLAARDAYLQCVEAKESTWRQQLEYFETHTEQYHTVHLLALSEEKGRGEGLVGRVWWKGCGVRHEENIQWSKLRADAEAQWLPCAQTIACSSIIQDEETAFRAVVANAAAELCAIKQVYVTHEERLTRSPILAEQLLTHHGLVSVFTAAAVLRGELRNRHALQRKEIFQNAEQANEAVTCEEMAEYASLERNMTQEKSLTIVAVKMRLCNAEAEKDLYGMTIQEDREILNIQILFMEETKRESEYQLNKLEQLNRQVLTADERDARDQIMTQKGTAMALINIDKYVTLLMDRETTVRDEVCYEMAKVYIEAHAWHCGESLSILCNEETASRHNICEEEAFTVTQLQTTALLGLTILQEATLRTDTRLDELAALKTLLHRAAGNIAEVNHLLRTREIAVGEQTKREAVEGQLEAWGENLLKLALQDKEDAAHRMHRRQAQEGEQDARTKTAEQRLAEYRTIYELYWKDFLITGIHLTTADYKKMNWELAWEEERTALVLQEMRGASMVEVQDTAERQALADYEYTNRRAVQQAIFEKERRCLWKEEGTTRERVEGSAVIEAALVRSQMLAVITATEHKEEKGVLITEQGRARIQIEAEREALWLHTTSNFKLDKPITKSFAFHHIKQWQAHSTTCVNEHNQQLIAVFCEIAFLHSHEIETKKKVEFKILSHNCLISFWRVQQLDLRNEYMASLEVLEEEEQILWEEAYSGFVIMSRAVCSRQAAGKVQRNWRRHMGAKAVKTLKDRLRSEEEKVVQNSIVQASQYAQDIVMTGAVLIWKAKIRRNLLREQRATNIMNGTAACLLISAAVICTNIAHRTVLIQFCKARSSTKNVETRGKLLALRARLLHQKRVTHVAKIVQWYETCKVIRHHKGLLARKRHEANERHRLLVAASKTRILSCVAGHAARVAVFKKKCVFINRCATIVQRECRSVMSLRHRHHLLEIRNANVVALQKWARARNTVTEVTRQLLHVKAKKVQAWYRGVLGSRSVASKRAELEANTQTLLVYHAAVCIQSTARGWATRRKYRKMRKAAKATAYHTWVQNCNKAATEIQKVARGYKKRKKLNKQWCAVWLKASKIQRRCKIFLAKRKLRRLQQEETEKVRVTRQPGAATMIQSIWKMHAAKGVLPLRRKEKDERTARRLAATATLCKVAAAYKERQLFAAVKWVKESAAKRLQAVGRARSAKETTFTALCNRVRNEHCLKLNKAAAVIQRCYKQRHAKRNSAAYRMQEFLRRVTPYVQTVLQVNAAKKRYFSLQLKRTTRQESESRHAIISKQFEAHKALRDTTEAMPLRYEDTIEKEETPVVPSVKNSLRETQELFKTEVWRRKKLTKEAVDALLSCVLMVKAERKAQWGGWVALIKSRQIKKMERKEGRYRDLIDRDQVTERRGMRLRVNKLMRGHKKTPLPPVDEVSHVTPPPPSLPMVRKASYDITRSVHPATHAVPVPVPPPRVVGNVCLTASSVQLGDVNCSQVLTTLESNATVLSLRLDNTGITDHSVHHLADLLTFNRTITSISLACNPCITDVGANYLISALKVNPSVRFLDTDHTSISQDKKQMLGYLLNSNVPKLRPLVGTGRKEPVALVTH